MKHLMYAHHNYSPFQEWLFFPPNGWRPTWLTNSDLVINMCIMDQYICSCSPGAAQTQPTHAGKNLSTSKQNTDEDSYLYPYTNLADSQIYNEPSY